MQRGYTVHILDRFSYAGKLRNLAPILRGVQLWVGDLKEWDVCKKVAAAGFDYLVHMASNTHVDHSIRNPHQFVLDNVVGTDQLLHAFSLQGSRPRTLVYSTDEVFGSTPAGERFSESAPLNPSNPYSASKCAIEALCHSYKKTFDYAPMIVRPCNTYGPRQHPEKAIPRFVQQALTGKPLTVHNDGSGARDWLHTDDHARAVDLLLQKGNPGESYNLAAGEEHTDLEIATLVQQILNMETGIKHVSIRPGHDKRYWMNPAKLNSLGWTPKMPFEVGFHNTVIWNRDNPGHWDADDIPLGEGEVRGEFRGEAIGI
jgi:dTDP-glucose 4,6-dehydratase